MKIMSSAKQKKYQAKVVDILKLQAIHADKLRLAKQSARDYNCKYKTISLIKEWGEWVVFALDLDEREEHESIMVRDKYPQILFCPLHSYRVGNEVFYFTDEETDAWRCQFLEALLEIVKQPEAIKSGFSKEWAVREIVGTTGHMLAQVMPYNTPQEYAEMITM